MEENQPERGHGGNWGTGAAVALAIFMAVYFLFPVIFMYPFYVAYGRKMPARVEGGMRAFFYPVRELAIHHAGYGRMIRREERMLHMSDM